MSQIKEYAKPRRKRLLIVEDNAAERMSIQELLDHDDLGFWERKGYHNVGDPWLEQRYWGD